MEPEAINPQFSINFRVSLSLLKVIHHGIGGKKALCLQHIEQDLMYQLSCGSCA